MVTSGKITQKIRARVIRDGVVIFDGKLQLETLLKMTLKKSETLKRVV